jgi:hypothetical protein
VPSTVNVNNRSVAHVNSVGISTAFPDPCKTPTPGGPVPIPYPNIAMSSDTDGTSSVKVDGVSAMVKGANLRMSTGDEAGSLMGVVSNKIKGKAEFTMYSFDVKFEGKNACRLGDGMQQNMGSGNSIGPAIVQPVIPGVAMSDTDVAEACKKAKETRQKPGKSGASAWKGSGVIGRHQAPIQEVITSIGLKVIFRATKAECARWIEKDYQPKPHDIIAGTTIKSGEVCKPWLLKYAFERAKAAEVKNPAGFVKSKGNAWHDYESAHPPGFAGGKAADGDDFIGIVGSTADVDNGRPLLANRPHGSFARRDYRQKYVTGDYDLYDVLLDRDPQCRRVLQDGALFARFQREVNKKMKWDGIQHGPQAQWNAKAKGEGSFSIPALLDEWLTQPWGTPGPTVQIAEGRKPMEVVDTQMTVVTRKGASTLESADDAKDFLICCGCKPPPPEEKKK